MEPENAARRPPTPWITLALIAANVIVFAWELAQGASAMNPTPQKLVDVGGNLPMYTLGGQWWRLGSAMFLHAGVLHIGMNMLCLWQARIAEAAFGRAAYATIYVVAGLLGGIATALHGQSNVVSVGASGAVFGVYGAFFALLFVRRSVFPPDVWQKVVRQMATFLGINFALGFSVKGIDMSAHLGGLAAGALGGAALVLGTQRGKAKLARTLAVGVTGLAIVAGVLVGKHGSPPPPNVFDRYPEIERRCLDRFAEITQRIGEHPPTAADGEQVEREVLAPWKAMRAEIDALPVPDDGRAAYGLGLMREYVGARQAAWEDFVEWARAPDDQKALIGESYRKDWAHSNDEARALVSAARDMKK